MALGFGLIFAAFARHAAIHTDADAKKKATLTPIVEVRERFEDRKGKSFSEGVNSNRNDVFNRDRLGFAYSDGDHLSGQVVYEYTSDVYTTEKINGASDTSDLLLGYVTDQQKWGSVTLGRQRLSIGDQRILGESDWKVASNSWDALRVRDGDAEVFAGHLEVSTYESEYSRLVGGDADSAFGKTLAFYAHDRIGAESTDVYTLDQEYVKDFKAFKLDAQAALQLGKIGSLEDRAWAGVVHASRQFDKKLSGYIEGAVFSGGKTSSSDMEFSAPYASKHASGGYADVQGSDNVKWLSAEANYEVQPKVNVELVYYKFSLYDDRDAWMSKQFSANKSGSVSFIDPTGGKGGDVGQEIDLAAKWNYTKTTEFSAGVAEFIPGDFVKAFISSSNLRDQIWFFTEVGFKFKG
jgi:hypothetical protein